MDRGRRTGAHCCELAPMLSGPVTLSWIVRHHAADVETNGSKEPTATWNIRRPRFAFYPPDYLGPAVAQPVIVSAPAGPPLRYLMRRTIAPNLVYVRYERGIRNPAEPILPPPLRATRKSSWTQLSRLLCREKFTVNWYWNSNYVLPRFWFFFYFLVTDNALLSNPKNYFQYFFSIFSPSFLQGPGTSFNYARVVNVHRVETFSDSRGRVGEEFEIEESVLTEKVEYIYISIDRLDVSGHANRGELVVRFTYYIGCTSRVLVTFDLHNNPRFFRGHDELRACKSTRVLTIEKKNEAWLDRFSSWGCSIFCALFYFGYRILVISNRWFLKKIRNKKCFISCLYYNREKSCGKEER